MADVISGGGDAPRRSWRSRRVAAVVVAVVVGGGLIWLVVHGRGRAGGGAAPAPSPPSAGVPSSPSISYPADYTARSVAGRTGIVVLTAGAELELVGLDDGHVTPVLSAAKGAPGHTVATTPSSARLLRSGTATIVISCDTAVCSPAPIYAVADGSTSAIALGRHDSAAPGADGTVLLLDQTDPQGQPDTAVTTAVPVNLAATKVGAAFATRGQQGILAGLTSGMLVVGPTGGSLVDPVTGATSQIFPGLVQAADATTVVSTYTDGCTVVRCVLNWTDLTSGTTTTVQLPAGEAAGALGVFSPDGKTLALDVFEGGDVTTGAPIGQRVYLLRAHANAVPVVGSAVRGDTMLNLAWSLDGTQLILDATPFGHPDRHSIAVAAIDHPIVKRVRASSFPGSTVATW
ncbi:MAG: hypothetical protein ACRDV3_08945 [Acidothermaceae bacterium]